MKRASGASGFSTVRLHTSQARSMTGVTGGPPPSNVTFVTSAATGNNSFGTTFSANAPASIVSGNLLLGVLYANGATGFTMPTGWSLVTSQLTTNQQMAVFTKTATGSEPGIYDFHTVGSAFHEMVIYQYSGSLGVDGTPQFVNTASGATGIVPSVTPAGTNEMWVATFAQNGNRTISSGPAGLNARAADASGTNSTSIAGYDKNGISTATGTATITWSATTQTIGCSLLLK